LKTVIQRCVCGTPDHMLEFVFDEEDKQVYVNTQLNSNASFLKRVLYALRYIFGIKSRYGCEGNWEETIISREESENITRSFLEFLEATK